ncbi:MAG: response regulator [Candidatus Glassbacteria bacterium]
MTYSSILVVDDNPQIRDSLEELLTQLGCSVTTAEDGYIALDKIGESEFDVILMDVKMPGIDGIETATRIRKLKRDAFIILMTAFSIEELAEKALGADVNGIVIKPFDAGELLSYLSRKKEATFYFSMLDKFWELVVKSLGLKGCRSLFEGIIRKGISGERSITFLERTGDGIFVNKFGGDGSSERAQLTDKFSRLLEELLKTAKESLGSRD